MLWLQELRWAFRRLVGTPVVAGAALVVLALGIGATVTVFTVVRAVLLRDLPLPNSDRLVTVERTIGEELTFLHSPADLVDLQRHSEIFSRISGLARYRAVLQSAGDPRYVTGASVTPDFLETLGARPVLGTIFRADAAGRTGETRVAVLSWQLWQSVFGGDRRIVGRRVLLDDQLFRVRGVMPEDLGFLGVDLWTPGPDGFPKAPFPLGPEALTRRDLAYLSIFGRLKPGWTKSAASAAVAAAGAEIAEAYPPGYPAVAFGIEPFADRVTESARERLTLLSRAVALVLVLACLTVSGLLIGRAAAREGDDDVRRALGASRLQTTAGIFAESTLLATGGGVGGVLVAFSGIQALLSQAPEMPRSQDATIDLWVLGFTLAIVVGSTLLAGALPAMKAAVRRSGGDLRWGGRGNLGRTARRTWAGLLVLEVGLAIVLLVGAGLLARRLVDLQHVDLGFDPADLASVSVALPFQRYPDPAGRAAFFDQLLAHLNSGARAKVAAVLLSPMDPGTVAGGFTVRGRDARPGDSTPGAALSVVSDGYFRTLGVPILEGRGFGRDDTAGAPAVTIVSRATAKRYWGSRSPLGADLDFGNGDIARVVGVVADVRYSLDTVGDPSPRVYRPFLQSPWPGMSIIARGPEAAGLEDRVRQAVEEIDAGIPVPASTSMNAKLAEARRPTRYLLLVLGTFAVLAASMAAVGLYGLLWSRIRAEEHALAIRLVLGATRVRLVAGQILYGLGIAGAGIGLGIVVAVLVPHAFENVLPEGVSIQAGVVAAVAGLGLAITALVVLVSAAFVMRLEASRSLRDPAEAHTG